MAKKKVKAEEKKNVTNETKKAIPVDVVDSEVKLEEEIINMEDTVESSNEILSNKVNNNETATDEVMYDGKLTDESIDKRKVNKGATHKITPVNFKSESEECRYYIMELMADKKEHKRKDIIT